MLISTIPRDSEFRDYENLPDSARLKWKNIKYLFILNIYLFK